MNAPPDLLERCPTCGSDSPSIRYVVAELGNGAERACEDEWHYLDDDA